MPVRSSAVGWETENSREVSVRRVLAYAAGIAQVDHATFDDAAPGGIVAPPPFCVALEWPVVSHVRTAGELGTSAEERTRGVHVSQDSTFHRPIRPGARLTTTGHIVAVRRTRAGALVMQKLETRDALSAEAVVTSWSASIYRGVEVRGDDVVAEVPPPLADADAGSWESLEIPIPRWLPHVYTEAAGIWNPIHTERRVALAAGLPDIILHGTATWALAAREIVHRYCGGDPTRLARLHGRFRAPVIPGTTVTLVHGAAEDGTVRLSVRNEGGEPALSGGVAELR